MILLLFAKLLLTFHLILSRLEFKYNEQNTDCNSICLEGRHHKDLCYQVFSHLDGVIVDNIMDR